MPHSNGDDYFTSEYLICSSFSQSDCLKINMEGKFGLTYFSQRIPDYGHFSLFNKVPPSPFNELLRSIRFF